MTSPTTHVNNSRRTSAKSSASVFQFIVTLSLPCLATCALYAGPPYENLDLAAESVALLRRTGMLRNNRPPISADSEFRGLCPVTSGIPAFRVAPSLHFLVCDRDLPTRNAPAPQARSPSRVRSLGSMLFRPQQGCRRVKRLCQANTASPAYLVSDGRRAPVPVSPHAPCPAGVMQRRDGMRLQRCLAAFWSPRETPLRLYSIVRRQRRPAPVPGAAQVYPDADATLRRIPFRLAASAAIQSSFRPWPGEPGQSRGMRRPECRRRAWKADRWHGRGSRAGLDHRDV